VNAPTKAKTASMGARLVSVRPIMLRLRHKLVLLSFVLVVLVPSALATAYLYLVAADQYSSQTSFTVRSEEFRNPLDAIVGTGFGSTSSGQSSDADILYDFILSQKLVENLDASLDLEAIYGRPAFDPVFALRPGQPIEDLARYWRWMVHVAYDRGGGMIKVEAFAFTAEDAHRIAEAIVAESDTLINALSKIARDDTMRSAQEDLDRAAARLRAQRVKLSAFRTENQIIDPQVEGQIPMGVLTALQQQLADALVRRTTDGRSDCPATAVGRCAGPTHDAGRDHL
jgi:capsular polysaccharide transport system permease protein